MLLIFYLPSHCDNSNFPPFETRFRRLIFACRVGHSFFVCTSRETTTLTMEDFAINREELTGLNGKVVVITGNFGTSSTPLTS